MTRRAGRYFPSGVFGYACGGAALRYLLLRRAFLNI